MELFIAGGKGMAVGRAGSLTFTGLTMDVVCVYGRFVPPGNPIWGRLDLGCGQLLCLPPAAAYPSGNCGDDPSKPPWPTVSTLPHTAQTQAASGPMAEGLQRPPITDALP